MKRASFAIAASTLLGFGVARPGILEAQEPARLPSRFIPRVSAAGAFDARHNGRGDPEMYLGLATLEWNTNVTGLALRVDGVYARRDYIYRVEQPCMTCDRIGNSYAFLSSKVTGAGGMVGATYDLRHHGAFRPYVLGTGGIVQTHDKFAAGTTTVPACATTVCLLAAATGVTQRNDRPVKTAAQLGAGVVYSWRWVSVLAETRYIAVDYANTRGLNGAVPVSLGVRF